MQWEQPMGGAFGYMINGGSAKYGSFAEFLGQTDPFALLNFKPFGISSSGGGGGTGGGAGDEAQSISQQETVNVVLQEVVIKGKKNNDAYNKAILEYMALITLNGWNFEVNSSKWQAAINETEIGRSIGAPILCKR